MFPSLSRPEVSGHPLRLSDSGPASGTPTPLLRVLVWSVLYALPVGVALLPLVDYDMWWHLRTGQWIVEHASGDFDLPPAVLALLAARTLLGDELNAPRTCAATIGFGLASS